MVTTRHRTPLLARNLKPCYFLDCLQIASLGLHWSTVQIAVVKFTWIERIKIYAKSDCRYGRFPEHPICTSLCLSEKEVRVRYGEGMGIEAKRLSLKWGIPRVSAEGGRQVLSRLINLVNPLMDILSCPEFCSSRKRSREASHVITWNNPRLMRTVQVTECANKDELMRDSSETLRPHRA